LGSEYGYAYDWNNNWTGDNNFSLLNSADIYTPSTIFISSASSEKDEGNSRFKNFTFVVSRVGDLSRAASADWSVSGYGVNPAGPDDFLAGAYRSGVVRFDPGEESRVLSIRISGDTQVENDEQFLVSLSNANGGSIHPDASEALGTIINDDLDVLPTLSVIATSADKMEGDSASKRFLFTVTRTGDLSLASSASWSVAGSGNNPAGADDFLTNSFRSGVIRFDVGVATRYVSIRVTGDTLYEADEQFTVSLFNPRSASIDPHAAEAIGVIYNDDLIGPTSNPIQQPMILFADPSSDHLSARSDYSASASISDFSPHHSTEPGSFPLASSHTGSLLSLASPFQDPLIVIEDPLRHLAVSPLDTFG
jgi:hypothetical protein